MKAPCRNALVVVLLLREMRRPGELRVAVVSEAGKRERLAGCFAVKGLCVAAFVCLYLAVLCVLYRQLSSPTKCCLRPADGFVFSVCVFMCAFVEARLDALCSEHSVQLLLLSLTPKAECYPSCCDNGS